MQQRRRNSFGLPDFARGYGAVFVALFGVCWIIAAIVYKTHWFMIVIGVLLTIRGTLRTIENMKGPKQKTPSVIKAVKKEYQEYQELKNSLKEQEEKE